MIETKEAQEQIIHASAALFMRFGVRSVSMDDISKGLGISKKTLYQLVPNKDELLNNVIETKKRMDIQVMDEIQQQSENALHEMVQMAEFFITIMKELKPTFLHDLKKYYPTQWAKIRAFHNNELRMRIKQNIDRGVQDGYYRSGIDSAVVSRLYVSGAWALTNEVLVSFDNFESSHINRQHILYHLYGLLSTKGHQQLSNYKFFEDEK